MQEFYTAFYSTVGHSQAHHLFCERVFGRDLCQHGFADMEQLDQLLQMTGLAAGQRALDLGCGNGMITEYLSDRSAAHITGLDFIPQAISQAVERTAGKQERLEFVLGDINQLELPSRTFDVIFAIDSIYFSQDYTATIRALKDSLTPTGQMAMLYSYGREPWVSAEEFPKENLPPDRTPLADALKANRLSFCTTDLTPQDYALALRRKAVLAELKPQFEAEEIMFIYENRLGDAQGVAQAIEQGLHARYLYQVQRRRAD
jgi:cyclopropane fatty-acyl-phospholipid synthase-like methyltransferase